MDSAPPYDSKSQPPYPTDGNPGAYPPAPNPPYPGSPSQPYAYPPQSPPYPSSPPPGTVYYPPVQPGQQPQQQSVIVVGATSAPVVVQAPLMESYGGYIAFACIVFWCCNWLFGLIAFILAIVADNTKYQDREAARRLGKASLGVSISGIIVTCIIVAVVVGVSVSNWNECRYTYYGECYN